VLFDLLERLAGFFFCGASSWSEKESESDTSSGMESAFSIFSSGNYGTRVYCTGWYESSEASSLRLSRFLADVVAFF
jgi:hypothetical protein